MLPDHGYKLLVSDIDGTLVDNQQQLVMANKEAIIELAQRGIYFTLASGRKYDSAERFIRELKIDIPLILYNGAQLVSPEGKIVSEKRLAYPEIRSALELLAEFELDALVYDQGKIYVEEINPVIEEYQLKDGVSCTAVGNLKRFIQDDVTKLLLIGKHEELISFARQLKDRVGQLNLVNSEANYLELLPAGVSKGEALLDLSDYLQLELREVVAIGDNLNDLEMIDRAGLGVATANAHPFLIRSADYVTGKNNEQGSVAEVIDKYLR